MKTVKKTPIKKTAPVTGPIQSMSEWLAKGPMKFGILATAMAIVLVVVIAMLAPTPMAGQEYIVPGYLRFILLFGMVFIPAYSIYMLAYRWTPSGNLDRHSFISLNIATTAISFLILGLSLCGLMYFKNPIFALMWLMQIQIPQWLMVISLVLFTFVMSYIMGIFVSAKYIATYHRARAMGIPRWKFLCAFPFGWSILSYPAIFLPEEKKVQNVLPVRAKWLSNLSDWAARSTLNASTLFIILPLVVVGFTVPEMFGLSFLSYLLPIVIFFGLWAIFGTTKMNRGMPSWFANMTVILNVIAVALYIWAISTVPTMPQQSGEVMIETIEITETIE